MELVKVKKLPICEWKEHLKNKACKGKYIFSNSLFRTEALNR